MILPEDENPGPSHNCLKNVPGFGSDDFNKMKETTNNAASACLIMGDHEVKSIGRLVKVEKKVQEPYFKGIREQKRSRKKVKQRKKQCANELSLEESQNKTEERDVQNSSEKSLTFEQIIERVKLEEKIKGYEKFKKQLDRKNQIKQRLAEQKCIEKYENLAETWLNLLTRRHQLKEEGSNNLQHAYKGRCNSRITISLVSRKYWNEEEDVKSEVEEKSECKQKETKEIKDLREEIVQQLVLVHGSSEDS